MSCGLCSSQVTLTVRLSLYSNTHTTRSATRLDTGIHVSIRAQVFSLSKQPWLAPKRLTRPKNLARVLTLDKPIKIKDNIGLDASKRDEVWKKSFEHSTVIWKRNRLLGSMKVLVPIKTGFAILCDWWRPTMQLPPDFKEFIALMISSNAQFVMIGEYAYNLYRNPRATGDIDFLVAVTQDNEQKLRRVLANLATRLSNRS